MKIALTKSFCLLVMSQFSFMISVSAKQNPSIVFLGIEKELPGNLLTDATKKRNSVRWLDGSGGPVAPTYDTKLEEGNYYLHIGFTDADGLQIKNEKIVRLLILSPWYKSWWASVFYAILLTAGANIYIWYQKRQVYLMRQLRLAGMNKGATPCFIENAQPDDTADQQLMSEDNVAVSANVEIFEPILKLPELKVAGNQKEFLDKCIMVTEKHLDNSDFNVKMFAEEMATCPSALYRKLKLISGKSTNEFIRYIRLRKAAALMSTGKYNVNETAMLCGFMDIRYFREQFTKLFGIRPSDYIKQHRYHLSAQQEQVWEYAQG